MGRKEKNVLAECIPLEPFGRNEYGETFELFNRAGEHFMVAYRLAGSINGRHWHEGKEKRKDPESLIFLKGQARLTARHMETGETLTLEIESPCELKVYAQVFHQVDALTDILFIEQNSLQEHKNDTKYL